MYSFTVKLQGEFPKKMFLFFQFFLEFKGSLQERTEISVLYNYLAGFVMTLLPNGPFCVEQFFSAKNYSPK